MLSAQLPMPLPAVFCSFWVEQRGAPGVGSAGTSLGSCLCLGSVNLMLSEALHITSGKDQGWILMDLRRHFPTGVERWPQGVAVPGLSELPLVLPSLCGAELLQARAPCGAAPMEGSWWPGEQSLKQHKDRRSSALALRDKDNHSPKLQGGRLDEMLENTSLMA